MLPCLFGQKMPLKCSYVQSKQLYYSHMHSPRCVSSHSSGPWREYFRCASLQTQVVFSLRWDVSDVISLSARIRCWLAAIITENHLFSRTFFRISSQKDLILFCFYFQHWSVCIVSFYTNDIVKVEIKEPAEISKPIQYFMCRMLISWLCGFSPAEPSSPCAGPPARNCYESAAALLPHPIHPACRPV